MTRVALFPHTWAVPGQLPDGNDWVILALMFMLVCVFVSNYPPWLSSFFRTSLQSTWSTWHPFSHNSFSLSLFRLSEPLIKSENKQKPMCVAICRVEQQFQWEQLQQRQGHVAGGLVAPPIGRRPVAADLRGTAAVGVQRLGGLQRLLAAHPDSDQFPQPAELRRRRVCPSAALGAPRNVASCPAVRNPEEVRRQAATSTAAEKGPGSAAEATAANG